MDVQTRVGMPIDEFIRENDKAPFELVNGERIPIVPTGAIHGFVISSLLEALFGWVSIHRIGKIFTETTFIRLDVSNWVKGSRIPDIAFYTQSRLDEYLASMPDWEDKPLVLIPDLCVEVVSKTDNYEDVDDKVVEYLRIGVRLVWVVKPRSQEIAVYSAEPTKWLTITDTLTGGDVLPDFSIPVADLFPKT